MKIFRETFVQKELTSYESKYGSFWVNERGTVEVEFNGKKFFVEANRSFNSLVPSERNIYLKGFVAKYRTGSKLWRATVATHKDYKNEDGIIVLFGRDERSGRCQKINNIWYSPEQYLTASA